MAVLHLDVDGVRHAVDRVGQGRPVVCLSSICHDAHDFDALAERLGDRFEFIREFGDSALNTACARCAFECPLAVIPIVVIGEEGPLPALAALGHVMRDAGEYGARAADKTAVKCCTVT